MLFLELRQQGDEPRRLLSTKVAILKGVVFVGFEISIRPIIASLIEDAVDVRGTTRFVCVLYRIAYIVQTNISLIDDTDCLFSHKNAAVIGFWRTGAQTRARLRRDLTQGSYDQIVVTNLKKSNILCF